MQKRNEGIWSPGTWDAQVEIVKNCKNNMESVLLVIVTNCPQAAESPQSYSYMPQAIML